MSNNLDQFANDAVEDTQDIVGGKGKPTDKTKKAKKSKDKKGNKHGFSGDKNPGDDAKLIPGEGADTAAAARMKRGSKKDK